MEKREDRWRREKKKLKEEIGKLRREEIMERRERKRKGREGKSILEKKKR